MKRQRKIDCIYTGIAVRNILSFPRGQSIARSRWGLGTAHWWWAMGSLWTERPTPHFTYHFPPELLEKCLFFSPFFWWMCVILLFLSLQWQAGVVQASGKKRSPNFNFRYDTVLVWPWKSLLTSWPQFPCLQNKAHNPNRDALLGCCVH